MWNKNITGKENKALLFISITNTKIITRKKRGIHVLQQIHFGII